jgi:hypothetical protein
LPVTFTVASGPGVLAGNTLSFTNGGWVSVVASQAGDANWNKAPNATNAIWVDSPPPPPATAIYVGSNSTTRGNWKGVYGSNGYIVINNWTSYPSYAQVTPSRLGGNPATWSSTTSDGRALQRANSGTGRIAACWYTAIANTNPSFDVTLNLTDGAPHRVAFYCLDWDGYRGKRAQRIDMLDGTNVLDSRSVSNFTNGVYLVWQLSGRVTARFTSTRVNTNNDAVLSGIFFDPVPASVARSAVAVGGLERESGTATKQSLSDTGALRGPWVWTSGNYSDEYPADKLIDGDTNTLWIGDVTCQPWRVILDLGAVEDARAVEVVFQATPWTNMGMVGSRDGEVWCDYLAETNDGVALRYLHFNFRGDKQSPPPAIREILWRDR